ILDQNRRKEEEEPWAIFGGAEGVFASGFWRRGSGSIWIFLEVAGAEKKITKKTREIRIRRKKIWAQGKVSDLVSFRANYPVWT
ncbi:hypothetical protein U1Q18_021210, partial [Sarracenia purpurea var. burkii]